MESLNRDATQTLSPHVAPGARRILIGYAMRSGSTLLQHMLGEHSQLRSYSDLSSYLTLFKLQAGWSIDHNFCVKPMDLFFLSNNSLFYRHFHKFLWIARDPRDSYLSSVESGYAYLFRRRGRMEEGIDLGLLERWKRIYSHYFTSRKLWCLLKYEDLVTNTEPVLEHIFEYLELPFEDVSQFRRFNLLAGGDYKLRRFSTVHNHSVGRHQRELNDTQQGVFRLYLSDEMRALGYI